MNNSHQCLQELRVTNLEKEDIAIKKDIEGLGEDMKEIKSIISLGFNKILVVMGFIISLLLTALGFMVYNFVIIQ